MSISRNTPFCDTLETTLTTDGADDASVKGDVKRASVLAVPAEALARLYWHARPRGPWLHYPPLHLERSGTAFYVFFCNWAHSLHSRKKTQWEKSISVATL